MQLGVRVCAERLQIRPLSYRRINSIKLETGLRPNSAGIPFTLPFRIEAIGFSTFGLLL